jgi:predicted phosphodiesterase
MTRHFPVDAVGFAVGHFTAPSFHSPPVSSDVIRILSDIHFGDRASRARQLAQLRPLLEGATRLVLNGDTLDTRPGPAPELTEALREEVLAFFSAGVPATLITGNHDADFTPDHSADLAGGRVFVVHGDILFDNIVPWSADAPLIGELIEQELGALPPGDKLDLAARLRAWRRAASRVPQRHQSERRGLHYAMRFAADTIWPPLRVYRILRAWQEEPLRADQLLQRDRPNAQIMLAGHTHRPGWWQLPSGRILINTGSFCRPFGGWAVDLAADRVIARRIVETAGEFRLGDIVKEFPLATR